MVILVRIFLFLFIFSSCDSGGDPNIEGCTDLNATNFNQNANVEDGNCIFSGCVDRFACNYNTLAIDDDGSCIYAQENFDCNDNCMVDIDCAGECGGNAFIDCYNYCQNGSGLSIGPFTDCELCSGCDLPLGIISLTSAGTFGYWIMDTNHELIYNINEDIYGFQLDLYGVTIDDSIPSVGDVYDSGLTVEYFNGNNFSRILVYSTNNDKILAGCGTLFGISLSGELTHIENIVFSGSFGNPIQVNHQFCEEYYIPDDSSSSIGLSNFSTGLRIIPLPFIPSILITNGLSNLTILTYLDLCI